MLWVVLLAHNAWKRFFFWFNQRLNLNERVWDKQMSSCFMIGWVSWIHLGNLQLVVRKAKKDYHKASLFQADLCQTVALLSYIWRTKWISKHGSKIFEKKCHVLCVLTSTRTQNSSSVYTVSASNACSNGAEQVMAETQSDVRNAKL